jgi:hypothetical protein
MTSPLSHRLVGKYSEAVRWRLVPDTIAFQDEFIARIFALPRKPQPWPAGGRRLRVRL